MSDSSSDSLSLNQSQSLLPFRSDDPRVNAFFESGDPRAARLQTFFRKVQEAQQNSVSTKAYPSPRHEAEKVRQELQRCEDQKQTRLNIAKNLPKKYKAGYEKSIERQYKFCVGRHAQNLHIQPKKQMVHQHR